MTKPAILSGLSDVAGRYDVLLCDVWGVIHNGRWSFPAACEALARFRAERGPVVLISNSPRPSDGLVRQLDSLEVPRAAWTATATSGDATRAELAKRAPGPAWAVGPERDAAIYAGTGVRLTDDPAEAAFISCTGLFDDTRDQPEDYAARFAPLVERGLEMVCANPDKVVHRGHELIWCAGALADLYAELGGPVVMAGKPWPAIYDLALAEAEAALDRPLARERVLCVGDGLPTDVKGANDQGLDLLFIAAGIHGQDCRDAEGRLDPARVEALLRAHQEHAAYAMLDLGW